jgi:hypothetical protein
MIEITYNTISRMIRGIISSVAASQSPVTYHFSMLARMFCWKRAGMEDTIAVKTIQIAVRGTSTG